MKQIKLFGLIVAAIVAVNVVAVASASAAVEVLPVGTATSPLEFKSKSGAGELLTLAKKFVKCTKTTGSGKFTSATLGTYSVLFEGCTGESGTTCTGVGDASGTIAQSGETHYVEAKLGTNTVKALTALVTEFHFTCEVIGIKILVLVRGCIAALAEPIGVLTKTTKDVGAFSSAKSGDPDVTQTGCVLESSIAGGAFESSALEGTLENSEFKKGGSAVEVLLMN